MLLGKKVAIFDWEWGRNLAPRDGQKISWTHSKLPHESYHCNRIGKFYNLRYHTRPIKKTVFKTFSKNSMKSV